MNNGIVEKGLFSLISSLAAVQRDLISSNVQIGSHQDFMQKDYYINKLSPAFLSMGDPKNSKLSSHSGVVIKRHKRQYFPAFSFDTENYDCGLATKEDSRMMEKKKNLVHSVKVLLIKQSRAKYELMK